MTTANNSNNNRLRELKIEAFNLFMQQNQDGSVEEWEVDEANQRLANARRAVVNLTQHLATPDQIAVGVEEPEDKRSVQDLLTFNSIPSKEEIDAKAKALAQIAASYPCAAAMVGGAPYLMSALERELKEVGIKPLYSFSVRESVDLPQSDGSVKKTNVFKHAGWVEC